MKRRSRFLALLMAGAMALAMAACSQPTTNEPEDQDTPDPANEPDSSKTYVIASDTAFPPFESLDTATNTYVGIDMDILAAIAEDQDLDITVNNVGFKAALGAVTTGQADGMIAGMSITEERLVDYDFSEGYFENGQILVVAADSDIASLEDLNGKVVATKQGTMGTEYAEANKEEYGFKTVSFEDSSTMYQAIVNGNADACFEDEAVIVYTIEASNLALKTVGDAVASQPYAFAVKKGENAELLEKFNAGLQNIKANGTYDEILAKYGLGE